MLIFLPPGGALTLQLTSYGVRKPRKISTYIKYTRIIKNSNVPQK